MTNILENLNGVAAIGIGIGLMTVVGECMGAGRKDEAVYYVKKLSIIAEVSHRHLLRNHFPPDKADHDPRRYGAGKCQSLPVYDGLDHRHKAACMDGSLHSGLWSSCRRRCEIFHDYFLPDDVVLPGKPLYFPEPAFRHGTDRSAGSACFLTGP